MARQPSLTLLPGIALALVLNLICQAQPRQPLTHYVRDVTANRQAPAVGRLPASQSMRITLVLPLRNLAALRSFLEDLYNPASPGFHQFLTVDEFTARYGPSEQDYDTLIGFARTHDLTVANTSRNRLNLDVTGTVANLEAALHVTLAVYQHPTGNRTFYAPDREPALDLSTPLWGIAGLDDYSMPRPALVRRPAGAQPNATTGSCPSQSFCGSDMRAAYYGATALTGVGQSVGLLEFAGTDLADLTTYYKNAGQTLTVPVTLVSTDGTSTSCMASAGCDDTVQTIDMTQALGMAPGMSSLVMYVGSSDAAILNAMATANPLNAQLSSSWTWRPADPAVDNLYFLEFAAQGQNFFQASGGGQWKTNSEVYPADDPYLTSVGGTELTTAGAGGAWASETAWGGSGGGISPDRFSIPSWQVATAAGCADCSQVYRNGPDVSANANYSFYVCADQTVCTANEYGGTPFAASMWAGYLALANQLSVASTGQTLGLINPTLYTTGLGSSDAANFHDITAGSNGYPATTGYDLVTGWGSPNGPTLIDTLLGLPGPDFSLAVTPGKLSLARARDGKAVVTTTISGGFDSPVSLSASGIASGIHVLFNPASIGQPGAGSSVMRVAIGRAELGASTFTITATGGGVTHAATFAVRVTP